MNIDYAKPFGHSSWCDVLPREAVCPELPARVLLHAGPPYAGMPPAPVVNAAVQAIIFEGLAADAAEAGAMLSRGEVQLRPAQDHGIVAPLAQVVSASMLLVAVEQGGHTGYAPIVEGAAPALRFGSASHECLERMRRVSAIASSDVAPLVRRAPVRVDEIIRVALAVGDECHVRIGAAHQALLTRLRGLEAGAAASLREIPAFVLPVLMAAAAAALRVGSGAIEAIGGNGIDFGIRRRGESGWRRQPALEPRGPRTAGLETAAPLPAIGDSAVIDYCGLGGQALAAAPLLVAEWRALLPTDALERRRRLIDPESGIVDAARVSDSGIAPFINLAILDRDGRAGLIGRGFYIPSAGLFASQ